MSQISCGCDYVCKECARSLPRHVHAQLGILNKRMSHESGLEALNNVFDIEILNLEASLRKPGITNLAIRKKLSTNDDEIDDLDLGRR